MVQCSQGQLKRPFGEIDQTELCTFYGVYSIPPRLTVCD